MSKHVKMNRNALAVSQSRINSAHPTFSMTVSSEMSSLTDLSAFSSKISMCFEMGGAKIESVEDFEKAVGLSGEEIIRPEANVNEIIVVEDFYEKCTC